jgi:hypothetical protein
MITVNDNAYAVAPTIFFPKTVFGFTSKVKDAYNNSLLLDPNIFANPGANNPGFVFGPPIFLLPGLSVHSVGFDLSWFGMAATDAASGPLSTVLAAYSAIVGLGPWALNPLLNVYELKIANWSWSVAGALPAIRMRRGISKVVVHDVAAIDDNAPPFTTTTILSGDQSLLTHPGFAETTSIKVTGDHAFALGTTPANAVIFDEKIIFPGVPKQTDTRTTTAFGLIRTSG